MDTSIDIYPYTSSSFPSLDEAILNVNGAGLQNVTVAYEMKTFDSVSEPAVATMPTSFTGHGDYDGVSFSVDGQTWYKLSNIDISLQSNQTYQSFSFNLSTIAAGLGLTLTADTQIKFQHYSPDLWQIPHDGITFDSVNVTGTGVDLAPAITSASSPRSRWERSTVSR